jgi:hypothetical protein
MPSASFTVFNITRGTYSVASFPIREGFVGATAEWIVENPLAGGSGTDLADFSTFHMVGAGGSLGSTSSYVYYPGGACWTQGGYSPANCGSYPTLPVLRWNVGVNSTTGDNLDVSLLQNSGKWVTFLWLNFN